MGVVHLNYCVKVVFVFFSFYVGIVCVCAGTPVHAYEAQGELKMDYYNYDYMDQDMWWRENSGQNHYTNDSHDIECYDSGYYIDDSYDPCDNDGGCLIESPYFS